MTEYIKTIITAVFSGLTAPLPVSSSAHFNFFSNVLGISDDGARMALYYNGFMLVFAVVIFISYRKIFIGALRAAFVSKKNETAYSQSSAYRKILKNIGVTLIPSLLLFIPVSKEKLLIDVTDSFFNISSLILTGFSCVITACVLVLALWYTRKNTKRGSTANMKSALRFSVYQLPCYIIPGFSHIAAGSANLLISDVKIKTFASEMYVYLAPSLFLVSGVKLIKGIASGVLFDPIVLLLGMIGFAIAAKLVLSLVSKFNIRRLFAFFSVYSALFGVFVAVISFYLK